MKKITNSTHLEGLLFSHSLEAKISGPNSTKPGTEFIGGSLEILTDDALNVVPVNFRYVTAKTKAGKDNATYKTLMGIINGKDNTVQTAGVEGALKLKIDTATGLNDFYNQDGELISYMINDGGFVHVVNALTENRNAFEIDMIINSIITKEADPDRETDAIVLVKGYTFNFMKSLLPITLVVKNAAGMAYFEDLEVGKGNPMFVKVWGKVTCSTVKTQTTEDSAFGGPKVTTTERKVREWEITGVAPEAYDLGDEAVLTSAELTTAVADRETFLATAKKKQEDFQKSKTGAPAENAGIPAAASSGNASIPAKVADFPF